MIHNYPDGAANDPRAPWNQKDPTECYECGGTGKAPDDPEPSKCRACDGTGVVDETEDDE